MKRFLFLLSLSACTREEALAPPSVPVVPEVVTAGISSQPNIVFILSDDQQISASDAAAMPKVNQYFANGGVKFTNAFCSTPLCAPSRATILTGRYSHNHGVVDNTSGDLLDDTQTIATWLQAAGYRNGLFGKYLNQYATTTVPPGWEDWNAVYTTDPGAHYFDYDLNENGSIVHYGSAATDYITDVLKNKAVNFIQQNDTRPFFLYFASYAPHVPATPAPRHANLFNSLAPWRPVSYNESDVSDKPAWVKSLALWSSSVQANQDAIRKKQYCSLQAVDDAVETMIQAVDVAGKTSNTIFIYLGDNGQSRGEHRWKGKLAAYEESIRVPFFARASWLAPRVDTNFVSNLDIAPTICEYAQATSTISQNGLSLKNTIETGVALNRIDLLLELRGNQNIPIWYGLRTIAGGQWTKPYKYVEYDNGEKELYDLFIDVPEMKSKHNNSSYVTVKAQLAARLQQLKVQ